MSIVKSFSVGYGDMFYIKHGSENFTVIDCYIDDENEDDNLMDEAMADPLNLNAQLDVERDPITGEPIDNIFGNKDEDEDIEEELSLEEIDSLKDEDFEEHLDLLEEEAE